MPIIVTCVCRKEFQTKDENAGRRARCPDCGHEMIVPGPGALGAIEGDVNLVPIKGGPPRTSGKAIASMVLGIFSFFCMVVTGIPAIIFGILGLREIEKSRGAVAGKGMAIAGLVMGAISTAILPIIAVLVALLLPAVQSAREAARRAQCVNNLKQIALAMQNYADAQGVLPPAMTTDPDGKPLLSWRVLLLPYLEQEALYRQFKLDEPWDGPTNKPLLASMPGVFACPSSFSPDSNVTSYQVLVGPGTLFEKSTEIRYSHITDGTATTLLVVEAQGLVPWSQPIDLGYTPKTPIEGLGSKHPGGFNAAFADGSIRFLKDSVPAAILRGLATRNGNEVISSDAF